MKLIQTAVRKPVSTLMICLGLIIMGYISMRNLSIDLLPNLGFPKLTVLTEYSGVAPDEIETLVSIPLEAAFEAITGVKRVTSVSREGISVVSIEFHWGTDMNFALLHTKEKVEEVQPQLPKDLTTRPRIIQWDPSSKPIITAVVSPKRTGSSSLIEIRESVEFLVKPRLEQLEGVAQVEVLGGGEREVVISVDPDKASLYKLSFNEIAAAVQSWNKAVAGGMIKKDKVRFNVRVEGEIRDPAELERIPVRALPAGQLLIRDIASVSFSEKIKQGEIRHNRNPTVAMLIYKEASGNTVTATAQVRKTFAQLEAEFPEIGFAIVSEEAGLIVSAISNLKQALIQGGILAFFVLLVFFQNFRDPFIVAVISPISVLATFILMYFAKVNLNIMSLGGLALGIGIFMDNAIVVIENLNRLSKTRKPEEAAISGTTELMSALIGSTLTTIVIFLPVIYIYGITGRLFRDQSLTISFALIAALMITVTLLPTLFRLFSPVAGAGPAAAVAGTGEKRKRGILYWSHGVFSGLFRVVGFVIETLSGFFLFIVNGLRRAFLWAVNPLLNRLYRLFNRGYGWFELRYHHFLIQCLNRKAIAFWITMGMMGGTILCFFFLKKELLPQTHTARFEIVFTTHATMGYEETERTAAQLELELQRLNGVTAVFSRIGTTSSTGAEGEEISVNRVGMIVEGRGKGQRDRLMRESRQVLTTLPAIESSSVFPERNTLSEYLRFGAQEFQIKIFFERIDDGVALVDEIIERLENVPHLVDIRANTEQGKPIFAIRYNEDLLKRLDTSKQTISEQVRNILRGDPISTFRRMQRSYDIVLTTPIRTSREMEELLQAPIQTRMGTIVLRDLIQIEQLPSIKELNREGQERFFTVSASLQGAKVAETAVRVNRVLKGISMPLGTRLLIAGEEEERRNAFRSIAWALVLSMLLVYMVMAAEFENLVHPLIIMSTMPMGLFGAFIAMLISGDSINVISGIGMMVAVGIVCDDAIVKVECANQQRERGLRVRDALMEASRLRLKPIILNTFTTVFGVFPMIYMSGVGTELQKPMAVVLAGSLISSTFLTLILIPVLYEMVTRDREQKVNP